MIWASRPQHAHPSHLWCDLVRFGAAVGLSAPAPFFGGSALRAPPPKKRRVRFYPSRAPLRGASVAHKQLIINKIYK
jgi:hypothetical protein